MTRRTRQRTWMLGGVGLVACGVLGVLPPGGRVGSGPILLVTDVLFAASVLLFAVGLSRDASVVSRRPLGVAALAIVAIWPLLSSVITRAMGPGVSPDDGAWTTYGYIALFIPTAAGLVAAMQIARSDSVPSPWRWAPAWVLGMQALAWAVSQAVLGHGSSGERSIVRGPLSHARHARIARRDVGPRHPRPHPRGSIAT